MKNQIKHLLIALALLALSTLNAQLSIAFAQGTAFTYQGQLQNNGSPASGTYNLTFSLFNTNTSGVAIAEPVTNNAVSITNGLFTVLIDFGPGAFTGETNWLQIGVESNGVATFTPLAPRQELTPTPNAIYAESADTLSGTLPASQLTSIGNTNGGFANFFVGSSGNSTMSGSGNTANGTFALFDNTSGQENTANGDQALWFNKSGSADTANGTFALGSNTTGSQNTADGAYALQNNSNDNNLVAIGFQALQNDNAYNQGSSSGNGENTAIGYQALQSTTVGYANTAIGYQALNQNTGGSENTANGDYALYYNTGGSENTANGGYALYYNTSGNQNTADGYNALGFNTNGNQNTAIGTYALEFNTSGSQNTANGFGALLLNTSGFNNVANGATALYKNTSGYNNVANGFAALYFNTTGYNNTANGYEALYDNTSGYYNTADGYNVLNNNTIGYQNTAMGHDAMKLNQSGYQNVAVGDLALGNCTNDNQLVAIGYHALQNDNAFGQGSYSFNGENTAIGYETLQLNTYGFGNTAIGYQALATNTVGYNNIAVGDEALNNFTGGENNIAIGGYAGSYLQSGVGNIYIGDVGVSSESGAIRIGQPGYQTATYLTGNVSIGGATPGQELSINDGMDVDAAGYDNGTVNTAWTLLFGGASAGEGIGSVRVGGYGDSYGLNFYTDYNKRMTILQNGHVGIGTTNATQLLVVGSGGAYCNGTSWVNGSDRNSKEDFAAISSREVLEKVSALPITEWQYKVDASGLKHIGPMAQDFHAAFGLNGTDDKHIATVDEEGVALAAIQGLNQKLEETRAENAELKQRLEALEKIVHNQKSN